LTVQAGQVQVCLLIDFYNQSITKEGAMKVLGEPVDVQEPITLVERRAFLKLPIEERRRIMAKQAKEMEARYKQGKVEDLETGEIIE
jgi:acyl-CoA reductase-like NAD-dependent aldehyde dehydrogenase